VITVPGTYKATAEAISYCGAKPVFIDVDEETYTVEPSKLGGALTPRTKAIIPVYIFGQMADMDPIVEFARKHGLFVIEDAVQAHGAEYKAEKQARLATWVLSVSIRGEISALLERREESPRTETSCRRRFECCGVMGRYESITTP